MDSRLVFARCNNVANPIANSLWSPLDSKVRHDFHFAFGRLDIRYDSTSMGKGPWGVRCPRSSRRTNGSAANSHVLWAVTWRTGTTALLPATLARLETGSASVVSAFNVQGSPGSTRVRFGLLRVRIFARRANFIMRLNRLAV